jgi:hypothetical protein
VQRGGHAPFAKTDVDVANAWLGPCGRVAYAKADRSLWLYEPGSAPRKIGEQATNVLAFDKTGASLVFRATDGAYLYDLSAHASVRAATPQGATLGEVGVVYDPGQGAPVPIPYAQTGTGLSRIAPDGTTKEAIDRSLVDELGPTFVASRAGSVVVGTRARDSALFAVDLAGGRTVLLGGLDKQNGVTASDGSSREDQIYLSQDGRVLVRQIVRQVASGDTFEPTYPPDAELANTQTGALAGSLPAVTTGAPFEAAGLGHRIGSQGQDGFSIVGDDLAVHHVGLLELDALLYDGTALASATGDQNRQYSFVDLATATATPVFAAYDPPIASRAGTVLAASRLTDRCVKNMGQTSCQVQIWELLRVARDGTVRVVASASQPFVVSWVGKDGTLLASAPIFTGPVPSEAPPGYGVPWATVGVDPAGVLHTIATLPSGVDAVLETSGLPIVRSYAGSSVFQAYVVDPAHGTAQQLVSAPLNIEVLADPEIRGIAIRAGDPSHADLYAGEPPAP